MITEYKGYPIMIKRDNNAPPDRCYVAYINDAPRGREHTRGDSEEDALTEIKCRIDNYEAFNQMSLAHLSDEEQYELISYIEKHSREISAVLKREHYILPNRFYKLTFVAIYNHYKLIEKTLNNIQDEKFNLDVLNLTSKNIVEKIALFSSDHFNSQEKINVLQDILLNL